MHFRFLASLAGLVAAIRLAPAPVAGQIHDNRSVQHRRRFRTEPTRIISVTVRETDEDQRPAESLITDSQMLRKKHKEETHG